MKCTRDPASMDMDMVTSHRRHVVPVCGDVRWWQREAMTGGDEALLRVGMRCKLCGQRASALSFERVVQRAHKGHEEEKDQADKRD